MADDGDEEKTKSFTALTDMDMGTILNGRGSDLTKYQNLSSEIVSESYVRGQGSAFCSEVSNRTESNFLNKIGRLKFHKGADLLSKSNGA